LLTGTGHRDRRLNRDSPGQTGTYGRSILFHSIGLLRQEEELSDSLQSSRVCLR